MSNPKIIQGGMGVAVSNWRLAHAVSSQGQLGVVSAALLPVVLARRLQQGDEGGHVRRALAAFPDQVKAQKVISNYFREVDSPAPQRAALAAMPTVAPGAALIDLMVLSGFVEVWLAKEGHEGVVGLNLLEKMQLSTLGPLYGAMIAGVDYVLMGAGIPKAIPGVLDCFAAGKPGVLRVDVEGSKAGEETLTALEPERFWGGTAPALKRPNFLAIVSSATLALNLARKSSGRVDGFVVEGDTAGGHNAPPRGPMQLNAEGEPIYGARDIPDLAKFREIGLPFWLAGSYAKPGRLAEALADGAAGIQVGTAFAFCQESGIAPEIKERICARSRTETLTIFTDPLASPTGFPFKVLQQEGTLSEESTYQGRERICDLGYLRIPYRRDNGEVGYRCPAEPLADYQAKGGDVQACTGRKCLCNGLAATVGLPGFSNGGNTELPLLTAGNDVAGISRFMPADSNAYSAADVIRILTAGL